MIEGFVGFKPTHRDNRIFFEPITNEVIDREIRISERNIAEESSEAVRKQYTVESHLKGAVREEFTARLRKIAEVETERACHENPSVDAGRRSKGYRGPTEGYPLDTNHIYMDVVKAVSRRDRASSRKKSGKGKKGAVDAKRHPVMDIGGGRSYEVSHHFPTADQVAAEMRDGKHQEMTTKITVRFPAGAEDNIPVSREYDVTGGKLRQKIDLDILEKNVKLLGALRIDSTVPDSIKRGLQMREGEIEVVHTRLLDLRVDRKEAIDAAGRTEKRSVAQSFEKPIRDAQQAILDTYEKVLGPKQYRELTIQVVEEKSDNIRKFIYAIDAKGSVRLCEESLEPGSERPAHSQLVDGQNVYGAGEIYVRGLDVISINNGSGHYRPDAKENILYVKSLLEGAGFTADGARLEHIKFPFVTIDMPIEELWHNNFFNGK